MLWLICHDPTICWFQRKVLFDFFYCDHNFLDQQLEEVPVTCQFAINERARGSRTLGEGTGVTRHNWDLDDTSGASGRRPRCQFEGKRGGGFLKVQQPLHY